MFNKVILVGNLTRDIELRYLNTGSALGKTGIATNRRYAGTNGEKKEEVCFIDITFWGRTAEVANQYLRKGSQVLIEGRLMFDTWQDQNGQNRSKHSVSVENMVMLGGGQRGQNPQGSYNQGGYNQNSPTQNSYQNQGSYNQFSQNQHNSYQQNFQNSPYQQKSQENKQYQEHKQNPHNFKDESYDDIPDVDIDDMGMDGDDELPF